MSAYNPPESDAQRLAARNRELSILNAMAQALNEAVDLEHALQAALEKVAELFSLRTGWVWLLDEDTGESYLAAALDLPPALADHPRRMMGRCFCLDTYRAGDLGGAANVNIITCSRLHWLEDGTRGLKYHASVPLYAHGKKLGVMNVASTDWRELSPEELRLLYTVGDLLSIAIERARLFERSVHLGVLEERNRLAREIHDTLAQGLTGISLRLETAEALLEGGAGVEAAAGSIREALELARANLDEARRSVQDLRAAALDGRPLADALRALAHQAAGEAGFRVEVHAGGTARALPAHVESGIFRIAQEALTNAARHARAKNLDLALEVRPTEVYLSIRDDGVGFDPARVPDGHFGLVGLEERARLMGGRLRLESAPGGGTAIEVRVPLSPLRRAIRRGNQEAP